MSARMIVELSPGKKVLFGVRDDGTGLSEVGIGDKIARVTGDRFKEALGSLADLVGALEQAVGRMARRPDSIELEFGASLTAECDLWVVAGDGEAEFKVSLIWKSAELQPATVDAT